MKATKKILPILILLMGALGCETIVDIDLPDTERKIVLNSVINPDSLIKVNLSKSLSVLDNNEFIFIEDAQINLSYGDQLIGPFVYEGFGDYYLPGFYPAVGVEYALKVLVEGMTSVSAETTIPASVPLLQVDTSSVLDDWGMEELRISLSFEDPAGSDNFYAISIYATGTYIDYEANTLSEDKITRPIYFSDADPFLLEEGTEFNNRILFSDNLFDGKVKSFNLRLYYYMFFESDTIWLDVQLEQVASSFYHYATSYEKFQEMHENPFGEPVQVYNNIEGGFGIFSSFSADTRTIVYLGQGKGI